MQEGKVRLSAGGKSKTCMMEGRVRPVCWREKYGLYVGGKNKTCMLEGRVRPVCWREEGDLHCIKIALKIQ
jgi:hypothetical protein